jgi:hypothetical protein
VNHWIDKYVRLNDSWGPGSAHTLSTPLGKLPEFSVRPRYLRDREGKSHPAHFWIDFSSGYLADGWQGVNFIPMGKSEVAGITGLPAWDPTHKDTYQTMIEKARGSLDDSRTLRLEGVIPYVGSKGLGYNCVRLFYVHGAVKGRGNGADLVVIRIVTHTGMSGTVQAKQDGTAHGPPG